MIPTDATAESRSRSALLTLLALIVLIAGWRAMVAAGLSLSVDEAYYVAWSKSPDFGYWTKPPMIAWTIGAARLLCGESAGCVRLVPVIAFPLSTLLMFALARRLSFTEWQACVAALAFATMPKSSFYGIAATTDGLLLLYWIAAMLFLRIALDGRRIAWLVAGAFMGLALLSKYSAGVFAASAALAMLHPSWRHWWRSPWPWLAGLTALLVFSPNLWWNFTHGAPTFAHTAEISQHGGYSAHPAAMLEFLVSQFLVAGPIIFGGFLAWLISREWLPNRAASADGWFLLSLSLPFLAVISLQALLSRAHANWAAPAMAAACLAAVYFLLQRRRWLVASFAINVLLAVLLYHFDVLVREPFGLAHTVRTDPFWATRSWPNIHAQVRDVLRNPPSGNASAKVASDDRAILAQLQWGLVLSPGSALGWQRGGRPANHFDQHFPLPSKLDAPVLLVTSAPAADVLAAFPTAQSAGTARSEVLQGRPLILPMWWLVPEAH
jgi:4-amino-4-deoxy-L-arabinose transferase-like glycosyltransferase